MKRLNLRKKRVQKRVSIIGASFLIAAVILTSCQKEDVKEPIVNISEESITHGTSETELANAYFGKSDPTDCSFGYEGTQAPEFWVNLCGDLWLDCGEGQSQSPINIVTSTVVEDGDINNININYDESTTEIINTGSTVEFVYDAGSYASMNNIDYGLIQFHFHTGSEHTIDGNRSPMEMHLVHRDPNTGLLAVMGVLFEEGVSNEVLEEYLDVLPETAAEEFISKQTFKVTDLLPDNLEFYTYNGSLTTPGCAEIVTWYVLKESITANATQLDRFREIMGENFRPTQDLNDRIVSTKS